MHATDRLMKTGLLMALALAGSAQAAVITLPLVPEPEVINIAGPYSVAWVHSFWGVGDGQLPVEGGGNLCNNLAAEECSVNGSFAILKRNFNDGIAGATETGPLFNPLQTFTVDFAPNPFRGGNSDGEWSYNTAPAGVTAWATKGGDDGYTVFYLVEDGTYDETNPPPAYSGIVAPTTGVGLPFGTWNIVNEEITGANLSSIIFFDSGRLPPQEAPEPGSLLLLGAALAGLGALKRRRS